MNYDIEELLAEARRRQEEGGWSRKYFTEDITRELYPKAWQFFDAGAEHRFRLYMAGNRCGKSLSCGVELTMHLTGDYHPLWKGRTFDGAVNVWVVGKSAELVRQTLQRDLLGPVGEFGTGLIPKENLDLETMTDAKKTGTPISSFRVRHKTGGYSTVSFKSGEQGREAFQAAALDIVWLDEEIPHPIFVECLVRLMTRQGILLYSFTPLKGSTETTQVFADNGEYHDGPLPGSKHVTMVSMDDVPHLTEEDIATMMANTPPYQRDARRRGIPQLGSGAIYPISEEELFVPPFEIPKHWKRAYGLDVGWNRTAAVWGVIDPDSNITYLYSEHYVGEAVPSTHAAAIRARGDWVPGVIDPASRGRTQDDGNQLLQNYKDLGLDIEKANNSVETYLWEILEAMQQGRLKVFNTLVNFRKEFRTYARDEKGKVIKSNDHLMDAFRYFWASGRDRAKNEQEVRGINRAAMSGMPTQGFRF